jgi:hypothetical protein
VVRRYVVQHAFAPRELLLMSLVSSEQHLQVSNILATITCYNLNQLQLVWRNTRGDGMRQHLRNVLLGLLHASASSSLIRSTAASFTAMIKYAQKDLAYQNLKALNPDFGSSRNLLPSKCGKVKLLVSNSVGIPVAGFSNNITKSAFSS